MSSKATAHLICGQICAGKTTYAKSLEEKSRALRFSPDEWMLHLFDEAPPKERFDDYYFRCCEVAWLQASALLQRDISVILDFGFWTKSMRNDYRTRIKKLGAEARLILIYCEDAEIRRRLKLRNQNLPPDCIRISEEAFDYYAPGFEPPLDEDEELICTQI